MSKVTFSEEGSRYQHQQNVILSLEKRLTAIEKTNTTHES